MMWVISGGIWVGLVALTIRWFVVTGRMNKRFDEQAKQWFEDGRQNDDSGRDF